MTTISYLKNIEEQGGITLRGSFYFKYLIVKKQFMNLGSVKNCMKKRCFK